jgi:DNA-binding NarL/FixJ family response regulator
MGTNSPCNILIADAQFLITESLKIILEKEKEYLVKDIVFNQYDLQKTLKTESISLLIMDFSLLDFESFSNLREIKKDYPQLRILILTNTVSKNELIEYNNIGIKNILYKTADKDELFTALEATVKGKPYYSGDLLDMLFELNEKKFSTEETGQLTSSEIEIVRLVADGLTTKEIAIRKNISFHTVATHRKNIFRKLGVTNASELLMYAIKAGIIDTIEYHI